MANYVEFPTGETGQTVLVEVSEELEPPPGVQKAGLFRKTGRTTVVTATVSFDAAVKRVVEQNVKALTEAVKQLATPPEKDSASPHRPRSHARSACLRA